MLSFACGSGELTTLARACQSVLVGRKCSVQKVCSARVGVAWSPSPPWKLLPGRAQLDAVVNADAPLASKAAKASSIAPATKHMVSRERSEMVRVPRVVIALPAFRSARSLRSGDDGGPTA